MQSNIPTKTYLLDFTRSELSDYVQQLNIEKYRSQQIFRGIYSDMMPDFKELSTLSKKMRSELDAGTTLRKLTLQKSTRSEHDRTTKYLWKLSDNMMIESVIIYEGRRVTFCISSQVGCALDCKFCATGKMGFLRNLTGGEIVEQVIHMKRLAEIKPTNVVFMGMGEPLLNPRNVLRACDMIAEPQGLAFSHKKITISTSGIAPAIKKLANLNPPYSLAISLNAVFEKKRREIMPVSIRYPLKDLSSAISYYCNKTGKRVSFEYIMIKGKNDSRADAERLLKFTTRIPCKINLIPSNSEDPAYSPPSADKIKWFSDYLHENKRTVTERLRKGWEIQAACGQLYAAFGQKNGVKIV